MKKILLAILLFFSTLSYLNSKAQQTWTPELNPKIDLKFLYVLPYANDRKTKVLAKSPTSKTLNFYTEESDTIVAVRKGKVVKIIDLYTDEVKSKNKINELIIEHLDGSFATYQGFKKGVFVKEGQTVFPGTPMAINNASTEGYFFSLMINYLKSDEVINKNGVRLPGKLYGSVEPYFCTKENVNGILSSQQYYTSAITSEIIQKEMTKKEIKNLGKK